MTTREARLEAALRVLLERYDAYSEPFSTDIEQARAALEPSLSEPDNLREVRREESSERKDRVPAPRKAEYGVEIPGLPASSPSEPQQERVERVFQANRPVLEELARSEQRDEAVALLREALDFIDEDHPNFPLSGHDFLEKTRAFLDGLAGQEKEHG